MRCFLRCGVVLLLAVAFPGGVNGEDGGWKMPNLNPFSAKGSGTGSAPTSGWKMPKMWPSTGKSTAATRAKKRQSNQPSTWSKMSNGTQQFFSKTADALTPWDNKPAAPAGQVTGTNSLFSQSTKQPKKPDVAPASWLGGSEKKSDAPKSVNDFLSMPRP